MASVWTAVADFLSHILTYIGNLVTTITGNDLLAVFVLAIPLVSFAVGLLSRLIHRTFR